MERIQVGMGNQALKEKLKEKIKEEKYTKRNRGKNRRKDSKKLAELYKQLKQHCKDWDLPASNKDLFVTLMQEIATELGLSKC